MAEKRDAFLQKLGAENEGRLSHKLRGVTVPVFVLQEELDKLKSSFQLYPDDVFVATYPKCGTTWTQHIVRLIHSNGVPDDVKIDDAAPWLDAPLLHPGINALPRPRSFKTHLHYNMCPCGPPHTTPCKYINVLRNPKDVAVSLHCHQERIPNYPKEDWDSYWEKFKQGEVNFGNYIDYLLSWSPHWGDDNVLLLKYEDMQKDLPAAISKIASFIGVQLSGETVSKIAEMTSFERMKQDNTVNYSWSIMHAGKLGSTEFLRKGVVGDWKNHFTPQQSAEMDAICAEKLSGTGLKLDYE